MRWWTEKQQWRSGPRHSRSSAIVSLRQVALSCPPFLAIVLNPQGKNPNPNDKETPQ
jgi:hypothetical protein